MPFNHGRHQTFADNHINHATDGGNIFFINVEQRNDSDPRTLRLEEGGSTATDDERRRVNRGHVTVQAQTGPRRGSEAASLAPSASNNPFCDNFQPRSSAGTSGCGREVQNERISPHEVYRMFCHCFVFRSIRLIFNVDVNRILVRGPLFLILASYGTKVIYGARGSIRLSN